MVIPADVSMVLVRHGETEWSSSGTAHVGHRRRRSPRTVARRRVRWRLGSTGVEFALVLCSPRQPRPRHVRAREPRRRAPRSPTTSPSGTTASTRAARPQEIRATAPGWTIFADGAPGGETAEQVAARADRVIARALAAGGPVALFSHGHFLRVLGARWVGLPASGGALLGLDTATLSLLGHERDQRVLRVWNS